MNNKIWLSPPHMGGAEMEFIKDAFENNWIAPIGPNVDSFEKDIENYIGNDCYVAALNSGTSALHLALILLGIGRGDEVLCQSMTFSASANPIVYQGAKPVFVDSEKQSWNISPSYLEEAIRDRIKKGKKPSAMIVVHLYGMPAAMDEIINIAQYYEIPVVEDAAEALGSSYKKRKVGTFGDMGIYSFNGNKIITTSAGGTLVSKNSEWIKRAKFLATQAKDNSPHYQHSVTGYNYKMSNICAGIGRGQMTKIDLRVSQRRNNFEFYKNQLSVIPEISFHEEPTTDYYSNRWLSTILIETGTITKEHIIAELGKQRVEARCMWKPMHLQPVFRDCPYYGGGIAECLFEQGLCLPSGSNLTERDREFIVTRLKRCFSSVSNTTLLY